MAAKGKATGEDDNDFDSFVEPAGLILSTVIGMMPGEYHDKARLLREAEKMKLPGNPLVRPRPIPVLMCLLRLHLGHSRRGLRLMAATQFPLFLTTTEQCCSVNSLINIRSAVVDIHRESCLSVAVTAALLIMYTTIRNA